MRASPSPRKRSRNTPTSDGAVAVSVAPSHRRIKNTQPDTNTLLALLDPHNEEEDKAVARRAAGEKQAEGELAKKAPLMATLLKSYGGSLVRVPPQQEVEPVPKRPALNPFRKSV